MTVNRNVNISIALGLVAVSAAVSLRLFSEAVLWYRPFSAILGGFITVIITNLLLNSPTNSDWERERSSEMFREKLRICRVFLRALS